MNYIKTYEDFDFSQTIPTTSKNVLTNYYSCDECNALWKEFNKNVEKCKFCNCSEIEDLSEDEYYDLQRSRLDEDEIEDMESERSKESEEFIDLINLDLQNKYLESKILDASVLPDDAKKELLDYVNYNDPQNRIEVVPDPKVDGTYAVRVYRKKDNCTFDLLWNRGAYDELEGFTSWPPVSGDLKFFF
jgi:hypothetical protein